MGIQNLATPALLAEFIAKDKEHLALIMGIVKNNIDKDAAQSIEWAKIIAMTQK